MRSLKSFFLSVLRSLHVFLVFFAVVAFVTTCSFLLFFQSVRFPEEDLRRIAPIVFFNVIILAIIFSVSDIIRRKIMVDKPVKEIRQALESIKSGDFSVRISSSDFENRENRFRDIAESINLLAEELAGVETLRTDFIANVSHELKTPLAVMQNYGAMLQRPDLSEENRLEYAKAVSDSSKRLASLITNILKLNKLENQQIFPSIKRYNLSEQLCECLLQFEDEWERKNINIETDIEYDIEINSDSELLSIVWNNLFSNALKFTQSGGSVYVGLESDEKHITVKVRDNGCGMTQAVGSHIFEKFYQGDTSHSTQGNGLGLALVKRVVDIMHGEITVESVYGKGSTFSVRFLRD